MQLQHIPLDQLDVSAFNMRHAKRPPDVSDILPSVRARGILQPLLVRPNGAPERFEIVAGRRRYFAARAVAEERGEIEPLPCAVMEPGDDVGALEASLIENVARLDADEMSQYETFVRLTREGKSVTEIAETFGITEIMVKRRLALGNLLPRIRTAYRKDKIDAETVRHLTLASKAQQKDWLALFDDSEQVAPHGYQLKQWLFGGQSIPTRVALFPVEEFPGPIVADLFGEDAYFADTDLFWQKQNEAIAAKRDALIEAGWSEVVVLEPGQGFRTWEHEKTPKKKGGRVFIAVSHRGEVEVHEGWLSRKEARRAARQAARTAGEGEASTVRRPEVTKAMQTYLDLHRHAVARLALIRHPGVAFRLLVAHAVASSGHWQVTPESQTVPTEAITQSIANSTAQQAFAAERREVLALLSRPDDDHSVAQPGYDAYPTAVVFAKLLALTDEDVLRIAAFVMAETMEAGSAVVEAAGNHLAVDARDHWRPDDAFFDLIRDKAVINAMLVEVAGKAVADGNVAEKAKTQKKIIRDCLDGANGRTRVEGWLPGWMAFPVRAYTETGSLKTAEEWARVRDLFPTA